VLIDALASQNSRHDKAFLFKDLKKVFHCIFVMRRRRLSRKKLVRIGADSISHRTPPVCLASNFDALVCTAGIRHLTLIFS
jgi:hypothetical protein